MSIKVCLYLVCVDKNISEQGLNWRSLNTELYLFSDVRTSSYFYLKIFVILFKTFSSIKWYF